MKYIFSIFLLFLAYSYQVIAQDDILLINLKNGPTDTIPVLQIQKIQFENLTDVTQNIENSKGIVLKGNIPNPFSEQTSLEFEIANSGTVEIIIYDNTGKQIQYLKCENCKAGKNSLQWNCLDKNNNRVQSGVYYYEVRFGTEVQAKKMILVK